MRESIQKSIALHKSTANESSTISDGMHDDIAAPPAAVESSCDSLGSKGKHAAAPLEVVPEDVLSFEQRRKEILRLTREAEERKKRSVMLPFIDFCLFTLLSGVWKKCGCKWSGKRRRPRSKSGRGRKRWASSVVMAISFIHSSSQMLEAEEIRKNELQKRVEDLQKR